MSFFENSVFFGVVISLLAYGAGSLLQNRFKLALFNPLGNHIGGLPLLQRLPKIFNGGVCFLDGSFDSFN